MKIVVSAYDHLTKATILVGRRTLYSTTDYMEAIGLLMDRAVTDGVDVRDVFGDDDTFIYSIGLDEPTIIELLETMSFVEKCPRVD